MVKKIFISTLILTVIIFSIGVGIGLSFDYFRISDLSNSFEEEKLDVESFVLEQQLIKSLDNEGCDLFSSRVSKLIKETYETGSKLENYESVGYNEAEYSLLKRRNILLKVRLLNSLEYLKENCGESKETIIFFYERKNEDCVRQGYALDELNRERDYNLTIFSFDSNFEEEPILDFLNAKYNIETLPTVIINGDLKKEGFVSKGELREILEL